MRFEPVFAAALTALALAGAAAAQTPAPQTPAAQTPPSLGSAPGALPPAPGVAVPALPDDLTRRSAAEDQAQAEAMTARLAALDANAEADEARMTQLRDWDLNLENARIRAVKPALTFHGHPSLPHYFYW